MVVSWRCALLVLSLVPGSLAAHDRTPNATYLTPPYTPLCFEDPYPQKCKTDDDGVETCIPRIPSALPDELKNEAAKVNKSALKQVIVNGKNMPLGLASQNDWFFSSQLVMLFYRAVVAEILGYETTTFGMYNGWDYVAPGTSGGLYHAAVGCGIMGDLDNYHFPECDYDGAHMFFEMWDMYSAWYDSIDAVYMAQQPVTLGRHNAGVSEAWYVAKEWNAWGPRVNESWKEPWPAYREKGVDLSYYKYLQDPKFYADYFDTLDQLPSCPDDNPCGTGSGYATPCVMQCGCWLTGLRQRNNIEVYIAITGDDAGFKDGTGDGINDAFGDVTDIATGVVYRTWKCFNKSWWLGPGCRKDPSTCIPSLTSGSGWGTPSITHKVGGWNMPMAMGSSATFGAYLGFPKLYRVLTYWWWPDPYLEENGFRYEPVRFETYDAKEYKFDKSMRTDTPPTAYIVGHHKFMESAPDDLLGVASNIDLVKSDFEWLISGFEDGSRFPNCGAGAWVYYNCIADLTCAWMRENPQRVLNWIPDSTICSSAAGQGLVDAQGNFVSCRGPGCGAKQCDWCPPGRFAETFVDDKGRTAICTQCPAGKSQIRGNQQSCDECGIGTFNGELGQATCKKCAKGSFQSEKGSTACESCPNLMTTAAASSFSAEQCLCPHKMFKPCYNVEGKLRPECYCSASVYAAAQSAACVACPEKGVWCGQGTDEANIPCNVNDLENKTKLAFPRTLAAFWVSYEEPLSPYKCIGISALKSCPGGAPNACGDGLQGIACGECSPGYYQQSGACHPCTELESSILFFLSPIFVVIGLTFFLHKISQAPVSKWGAPANGIGGIGYLTLVYVQTVGAILAVFPALPSTLSVMSFSTLSTEMTGLFHIECAGPQDYTTRFNMKLFIPQILAVLMFVAWCISLVIPGIRMDKNIVFGSLGGLLKTFFVTIATLCVSLFQVYQHPNGEASMVSASQMVQNSDAWLALVPASIVSVSLNCLGYLSVISYAMYVAPKHFHKVAFRRRWKFMIMKMRPSLHWWLILVLFRAFLLSLTAVLFKSIVHQMIWIVISLILYFGGSYALMPWRNSLVSVFDVMTHCGLLLMCLCMPFLFEPDSDSLRDVADGLVLLCIVSFLGAAFGVLWALFLASPFGRQRKAKLADKYAAEIVEIFPQMREARLCAQMLLDLPEPDISLIRSVAAILDSELFGRRSRSRLQWRSEEEGNIRMQPVTEKFLHPNWQTQEWWS